MDMVPLRKPIPSMKSWKTYRKKLLMKSKSSIGQQLSAGRKMLNKRFVNCRHSRGKKGDIIEYLG